MITTNSFVRFGINHTSVSSLNLWIDSPGWWANRYIKGVKDEGGPAMWRGTAVGNGLAALLRGATLNGAVAVAHANFNANCLDNEEADLEQQLIKPMLEQCSKWKPPSDLLATELKVEYWFDQIPIPLEGYVDFSFEETDIELKTTKRCPSEPSPAHVRQAAIYRKARDKAGSILYVTDKKWACYPVTDEMMDVALLQLEAAALSLNNFLARMDSKEDILKSLPLDESHWRAPKTNVPLIDVLAGG